MRALPAGRPIPAGGGYSVSPPDPYLRVDTNDYSLDPALVGRRVEVRVDQQHMIAGACWIPASSPADTRGCLPSTGRSPRWSTPAR